VGWRPWRRLRGVGQAVVRRKGGHLTSLAAGTEVGDEVAECAVCEAELACDVG
jgi:hypothetical protein